MPTLTLKSHAKLNLYLEVLKTRPDNYHNLSTLFERISLADTIKLTSRKDGLIKVISLSRDIPKGSANIAYKSAQLLQDKFGRGLGVDIRITKRIPVGAGMGGGSSNAATVLMGLNRLWKLGLSQAQLLPLAKALGADVPFFIYQTTFAIARGRGDIIRPLRVSKRKPLWQVLVVPKLHVSTPIVYKIWDELKLLKNTDVRLTNPKFDVKLIIRALTRRDSSLLPQAIFNSLEQVTFRLHPELIQVKKALFASPAVVAAQMSGSGPTLFGITTSAEGALAAARQLKSLAKGWRIFVVRSV